MSSQSYQADYPIRCTAAHADDTKNVAVLRAGPLVLGLHHNEAVELHRQLDKILRDSNGQIASRPVLVVEQPLAQWEIDILAGEG